LWKTSKVTGHTVVRSYLKGKRYSRSQLTALWANDKTKELFNELTKKLVGSGKTAEHIARAFGRKHGGDMFHGGDPGDGVPPESKSPPDGLESWKSVLENSSAALSSDSRMYIQLV
jgi:hypothetical protein